MRLKPKYLNEEVTIDEYNAYQYLLYNMDCWSETIRLDMEVPYHGAYADYLLYSTRMLLNDKNDTYKIRNALNSNSRLQINLTNVTELLDKKHMEFTCTLYYKKSLFDKGVEYQASDSPEIPTTDPLWVERPRPSLKDYLQVTLPCHIEYNSLIIPLWDTSANRPVFAVNTILNKEIVLNVRFNKTPWIDVLNGRANEPYEILVDNLDLLENIVENAPDDGTLTVIRLDSNKMPYRLRKTLEIDDGQNIEIRGGTGYYVKTNRENYEPDGVVYGRTIIDGSVCRRSFRVRPGGRLTLQNLDLRLNNCITKSLVDYGRGGAVLVEAVRDSEGVKTYGVLKANNCMFRSNKANYGGAIFSYHAGVFLENCDFIYNTAAVDGGAVYYWARDVRLEFPNYITKNKTQLDLIVTVYDYAGHLVKEGHVKFYTKTGDKFKAIDDTEYMVNPTNGTVTIPYSVNTTKDKNVLHLVAHYIGGSLYDDEAVMNTINVIFPEHYVAEFISPSEVSVGTTLTITVQVKGEKEQNITNAKGKFIIGEKKEEFTALTNVEVYYVKYKIPENWEGNKIDVRFELEESIYYDCEPVTQELTVGPAGSGGLPEPVTALFVNSIKVQKDSTGNTYTDAGITSSMATKWKNAGITDVFVRCLDYATSQHNATIKAVISILRGTKIRVHAVLNCFCDTTVDKKDLATMYGKVNPSLQSRRNTILKQINMICKDSDISGICFDYCRFCGGTTQSWNGYVGLDYRAKHVETSLSSFVERVREINPKLITSIVTMPEEDMDKVYGQNPSILKDKVDYIMPQTFKGNYKAAGGSDNWIVSHVNWLANTHKVPREKIISIIQTYEDDTALEKILEDDVMEDNEKNTTFRNVDDMNKSIEVLVNADVKGVALFREGVMKGFPKTFKYYMEVNGKK